MNRMEYESVVQRVGASQEPDIEIYYLFADSQLAHVSSSSVKALQQESGFIHDYVPLHVKQALEIEMSNRYMLAVTGTIGAGKSYRCKSIKKWCDENGVPCTYIDMDEIAKQILNVLTEPAWVTLRKEINKSFPENVLQEDGFIDRKKVGELVFNNSMYLSFLNGLMEKPIQKRLVNALRKASGLVLVESALFAEAGIMNICNNNIMLVDVDGKEQRKRLEGRGHDKEQTDRRIHSQFTHQEKLRIINEERDRCGHGNLIMCDASWGADMDASMEILLKFVDYPVRDG